ncbi:MAG: type II secretion system protein [Candidatus Gastranaerophilaceae bacterium]
MKNKKIKAFTMAEVLLVLGIIGIVAAITLPNLKDSTDSQVNVSKAKKVYADLTTAFERANNKYGNIYNWSTSDSSDGTQLFNRLVAFLDVKKTCEASGAANECWSKAESDASQAILGDGSSIMIKKTDNTVIYLDVNGPENGSATVGVDVFNVYINKKLLGSELLPYKTIPATNDAPGSENYLQWVLMYGNEDYTECGDKLNFYTSNTTCN